MCEREDSFGRGELRNNNQLEAVRSAGDANANNIQTDESRRTGETRSLLSEKPEQDKLVILGTNSQCEDPELAEFEMLECQELETDLVEEGEDFVGLAELLEQPCSHREAGTFVPSAAGEQETSRTETSSETEVFATCLSTISATQMTDSWNFASAISEDLTQTSQACSISERGRTSQRTERSSTSGKSTMKQKDLNVNLNSTACSEAKMSEEPVINLCKSIKEEYKQNNNPKNEDDKTISEGVCDCVEHKVLSFATKLVEESNKMDKSTQADESPDSIRPTRTGTKGTSAEEGKNIKKQGSFDNSLKKQNSFDRSIKPQPPFSNTLKKQHSFDNSFKKQSSYENTVSSCSSSLERRKPWGSPGPQRMPTSPKTTSPKRQPTASPVKVQNNRALSLERGNSFNRGQAFKTPGKTNLCSGIPKPVLPQQKEIEPTESSPPQKPKNVRPKIITYVRKNTQAKQQDSEVSTNAPRLSSYPRSPAHKEPKTVPQSKSTPVLSSSNLLFDKYRQEMQKVGYYPGAKPPVSTVTHRLGGRSGSFHDEMTKKYLHEDGASVYRSPRSMRPQLGLGAVTRQPAAKMRAQLTGQRSATTLCQSTQAAERQDLTEEQRRLGSENTLRSFLLRTGQSGLRPPGFSTLPAARLAALGFVRSSSVSSVSSNQSNESSHSDPCRPRHFSSGSDETSLQKANTVPSETLQNASSLQRRNLPPQHCSPHASRRELQKESEAALPPKSSPKRFAVVSPKPQSPARRPTPTVHGSIQTVRAEALDRTLIQQLQKRCEDQDLQLQSLQAQLKKASLCLDVFSITTQHFCNKGESAIVKERELSRELARIRDEVASSVAHWEQLQQEKENLEHRFEAELQRLRAQQRKELGELEERLKAQHVDETENLQAEQRAELQELRFKQQEQLEEMTENHEASLSEMETTHSDTLVTLQEEHTRTVKNLKMAHEQQKKSLEEEFEKIRLSLQDQVDTLTFQNRSLSDRAKRFEEALRKSTDEQIVDALAPYKHIEEDLKSLKEVLEMKNQQIHQQELKITELEKIAEKNVYLEEKLQVLQQQNEDLKERIGKNLAVSRQLSEENANLQVHVEKESNEKKRLSRTNEELLWRLQTGELSPRMSPASSPIHRPSPESASPARPHSYHQ